MQIAARDAFSGKAEISAKSYVQNGLVAMWDGIENAGWGVHDGSFVGMRNLTGYGCDLDNPSNAIMSNDGLATASGATAFKVKSTESAEKIIARFINAAKAYTFEIVGRGFAKNNGVEQSVTVGITGHRMTFWKTSAYGLGSINVDGGSYFFAPGGWITNGSLGEGFASHSRVCTKTMYRTYINAILKQTSDSSGASFSYTTEIYTRGRVMEFNSCEKIHRISIYDRALTAEETAHNYEIDKARFNLE